jgi:hypothetical protein
MFGLLLDPRRLGQFPLKLGMVPHRFECVVVGQRV